MTNYVMSFCLFQFKVIKCNNTTSLHTCAAELFVSIFHPTGIAGAFIPSNDENTSIYENVHFQTLNKSTV